MTEKTTYVRSVYGLIPASQSARDFFNGTKLGQEVTLTSRRERNLAFHRKAFALLEIVYNSQEMYETKEQLRLAMTVGAGFVKELHLIGGGVTLIPESWAFNSMKEERFDELYSGLVQQGLRVLPRGWDEEELRNVVERINSF